MYKGHSWFTAYGSRCGATIISVSGQNCITPFVAINSVTFPSVLFMQCRHTRSSWILSLSFFLYNIPLRLHPAEDRFENNKFVCLFIFIFACFKEETSNTFTHFYKSGASISHKKKILFDTFSRISEAANRRDAKQW